MMIMMTLSRSFLLMKRHSSAIKTKRTSTENANDNDNDNDNDVIIIIIQANRQIVSKHIEKIVKSKLHGYCSQSALTRQNTITQLQ